jgi:hypothetical protein
MLNWRSWPLLIDPLADTRSDLGQRVAPNLGRYRLGVNLQREAVAFDFERVKLRNAVWTLMLRPISEFLIFIRGLSSRGLFGDIAK